MTPAAYPRVFLRDGLRHRRRSFRSSSRAGSPLLFGLAPRGVFRASRVATGAVGSYPTFSPLPKRCVLFEDVSQVSLRDATVLRSAGGLFSVALSVAPLVGQAFLPVLPDSPPGVTRRVALSRVPLPTKVKSVPQDGVRTFLPFQLCSGGFTPPLFRGNQRSPGPPAIFIIPRWARIVVRSWPNEQKQTAGTLYETETLSSKSVRSSDSEKSHFSPWASAGSLALYG